MKKKVLFEFHSSEHYHTDFVVYETEKSIVIDYYVNIFATLVGKSYFRKFSGINSVLDYWKGDDINIMRVLLDEFFGNGYRNEVFLVA